MTHRTKSGDRDPHLRFGEWLLTAGDEEPPRDVAVHASLCADCQRQIAALDMLTTIDPTRAGPPPARAAIIERRLGPAGRVAVTVGGVAAVAALGIGGWRLADGTGIGVGAGGETPNQEVLGNTGGPEVTLGPSPSDSADASSRATSPSVSPSAIPSGTGTSSQPLPVSQAPLSQPPAATPQPTSLPTRTPKPTLRPTPTPAPSSAPPSPSAQPTPTPEITPAPTEPPSLEAAA